MSVYNIYMDDPWNVLFFMMLKFGDLVYVKQQMNESLTSFNFRRNISFAETAKHYSGLLKI